MAKRKYMSPVLFTLDDGGEEIISFGGSQGTSGYDSIFSFADEDLESLCSNYDDTELASMDTDGNQVISWEEYEKYIELNP